MNFKHLLANCLMGVILISNTQVALAANNTTVRPFERNQNIVKEITYETRSSEIKDTGTPVGTRMITNIISQDALANAISNVDDMNTQLNELYNILSEELNLNVKYIKILHMLAGGKTIYTDTKPNIYLDSTVSTMNGPFSIVGANTIFRSFEHEKCKGSNIDGPSEFYVPDAAYSVASDIRAIMNTRLEYDRGGEQMYFDSLKDEVKDIITFSESVLTYIGESEETVNSMYRVYEKMLYDKQKGENIINTNLDGTVEFKEHHLKTLKENNISSDNAIRCLAMILSYDENMANNDSTSALRDEYTTPYVQNYTSRENMMIAQMSLVGKCRYIWGGGHTGAANIDGINPMWEEIDSIYGDTPTSEVLDVETKEENTITNRGYNRCIQPGGSWCIIHGASGNDCSFKAPIVYSLDDYINTISRYVATDEIETEKFKELLSGIDFSEGVPVDTLNGLDCSGYSSWLYNQITDRYTINTTAQIFSNAEGMRKIPLGSKLLPGDTFAWSAHIVVIVGRVSDSNKVYVTTEATPNAIKFGVVHYAGASKSEIDQAKEIARQANILIGGLKDNSGVNCYNMNACGVTANVGRFGHSFIDEGIIVSGYNKPIKDMYAKDIIQYTLSKLPYSYVTGYNDYETGLFDKSVVAQDLGLAN